MLSWSTGRRLAYLLLILAVAAVIGVILFIFLKPAPSCFDGKRNQDEAGIDCGGSCSQVCSFEIANLRERWTRVFRVADGKYDTATLVENPNPHHSARELEYQVKVFDSQNLLISVRKGRAFVNPGEQLIIFNSRLEVGQLVPVRAVFEWLKPPRWQKIDRAMPKLVIVSKAFANEPLPRLTARVTNESLLNLKNIQVTTVLSDQNQNALAVSSTLIERLDRGETKEIVFTWPAPLPLTTEPIVDLSPHLDLATLP